MSVRSDIFVFAEFRFIQPIIGSINANAACNFP